MIKIIKYINNIYVDNLRDKKPITRYYFFLSKVISILYNK